MNAMCLRSFLTEVVGLLVRPQTQLFSSAMADPLAGRTVLAWVSVHNAAQHLLHGIVSIVARAFVLGH